MVFLAQKIINQIYRYSADSDAFKFFRIKIQTSPVCVKITEVFSTRKISLNASIKIKSESKEAKINNCYRQ